LKFIFLTYICIFVSLQFIYSDKIGIGRRYHNNPIHLLFICTRYNSVILNLVFVFNYMIVNSFQQVDQQLKKIKGMLLHIYPRIHKYLLTYYYVLYSKYFTLHCMKSTTQIFFVYLTVIMNFIFIISYVHKNDMAQYGIDKLKLN